jgi:hypothetical protein
VETEKWKKIPGFSMYSVSDQGRIRNDDTDRIMRTYQNQYDVLQVGLFKNGVQYHRSVPLLVAKAFVKQDHQSFNTPINLNGVRYDCRAKNLVWRPRWFAIKYNQQFYRNPVLSQTIPIRNRETEEVFENSMACAIHYGLLEEDLALSIWNRTVVWPHYVMFETVHED